MRHVGALDGLSRLEAERDYGPTSEGQAWLISRLRDGGTVTLDAGKLELRLQHCLDRLEHEGVEIVVLLCTGEFPSLRTSRAWLLEPDVVVCATIASLLGDATAGVIVPLPQQVEEARTKWRHLPRSPFFGAASPYDDGAHNLVDAARTLQEHGAQALVLDCMGYTARHKQALLDAGCRLPILVSGSVLAGALGAFV